MSGLWHLESFERFTAPYPVIQAKIEERVKAYPGQHLVESNGVGDPVIENLMVRVTPFTTTAKSKLQAIQALQLMIERNRVKFSETQMERELGLYQWEDKDLVQDCVMSAAIAAQAMMHTGGDWAALPKVEATPVMRRVS